MKSLTSNSKRNLFEIENARNLTRSELVSTFVPTESFWRLLSAKNHIVLGARGSGKTALAKMLSHDHLALLNDPTARAIVRQQDFIGIYVPTKLEWVGGLRNKYWQTEGQKESFFQWRLNLSSCVSLLYTIESCIRSYCKDEGDQARVEKAVCESLSEAWIAPNLRDSIEGLRHELEDIEYRHNQFIARQRVSGTEAATTNPIGTDFDAELFAPLKRGIQLAERHINIKKDCAWLLCLDETEFLDEMHHRILNSHMRTASGNVFFKLTTMPYCHYTLATNTDVSLDVGHDFEYVYIDSDPVYLGREIGNRNLIGTQFAGALFHKRAYASGLFPDYLGKGKNIGVKDLLGKSPILDEKPSNWDVNSESYKLLLKYGSEETIARANVLLGLPRFRSEIARKIGGVLILRDAYNKLQGNAVVDVYSGASLAIRCGDSNPRRLIRIFNALVLLNKASTQIPLPPREQTRVIMKLSTSALVRVQSEPKCGKQLYNFLNRIGTYMHDYFHNRPLTTDQVTSFKVNEDVPDETWQLIQRGVELGLLYPNIGANARDELPYKQGVFHFGFILAPHFFLMPRRGQTRSLKRYFARDCACERKR